LAQFSVTKVRLHQSQLTVLSVDKPTLRFCCWLMWHVSCHISQQQ